MHITQCSINDWACSCCACRQLCVKNMTDKHKEWVHQVALVRSEGRAKRSVCMSCKQQIDRPAPLCIYLGPNSFRSFTWVAASAACLTSSDLPEIENNTMARTNTPPSEISSPLLVSGPAVGHPQNTNVGSAMQHCHALTGSI